MKLPPCPNCGSRVEITSSRDCRVLNTYIKCQSCEGSYFSIESEAFINNHTAKIVGISDAEICAKKYIAWVNNNAEIKGYRCDGEWD